MMPMPWSGWKKLCAVMALRYCWAVRLPESRSDPMVNCCGWPNQRLATSSARIYAAGDICSRYQFTHAADALARIVIQNTLFLGRAKVSALIIPWCTYTDPELAHVGLSEKDAKEQGVRVRTFMQE